MSQNNGITITLLPVSRKSERNAQVRVAAGNGGRKVKVQRSGKRSAIVNLAEPLTVSESSLILKSLAGTNVMYAPCIVTGFDEHDDAADPKTVTGTFAGFTNGVH